jgi:hypothetical protein
MKQDDRVRVYPHGKPEQSTIATVAIISTNQCSIAVAFEDSPPFRVMHKGTLIDPGRGMMLCARREMLNGQPWGPWIEIFDGGHFEIEEPKEA